MDFLVTARTNREHICNAVVAELFWVFDVMGGGSERAAECASTASLVKSERTYPLPISTFEMGEVVVNTSHSAPA